MDLIFRDGRTTESFSSAPVTDDDVAAIYDLVKWGPTGANMQPLRILMIRSEAARQRLLPLMFKMNREKVAAAPMTAVLSADTFFHERAAFAMESERAHFAADPLLRESAAVNNALIQAGYFILGVRAIGLAAGPMGGFFKDRVNQELFPDGRERAVLMVNIGWPDPSAQPLPRLPRLEFDEVVRII